MKRAIVIIMALFTLLACACGAEKSQDEQFLLAFQEGLMARWDISLVTNKVDDYDKMVDAELAKIGDFDTSALQDEKLRDLADQYIHALNDSKIALSYMSVNSSEFLTRWQNAYNRRTILIEEICRDYSISFPKKYDKAINSILQSSSAAEISLGMDDAIQKMLDNAEVNLVDGSRNWKEYSVFVKNESKYDISNLQIQVQIYDEDNVALDTCYCDSIKLLRAGESARVTFSTDKDFVYFALYATHY